MSPDDTRRLTHGLTRCDEAAWHDFHQRFFPQIQALAIARGVAACDAPDIVQGVYLRILRHAKVFHDPSSLNSWLACLTRCEVIDSARRKNRRTWLNERFQHWQESRRIADDMESSEHIEEALASLDENERRLMRRHYLEGWSQEAIAEQQQTSVKAVESRLARLRKRLRQHLENPSTHPIP
jgi:RNA polymerase sigma factor (sigma-70 family)